MKQHRFAAGGSVLQLLSPLANKLPHVGLGSTEFLYVLSQRTQLLFGQMEYAMAGCATIVPGPQNV